MLPLVVVVDDESTQTEETLLFFDLLNSLFGLLFLNSDLAYPGRVLFRCCLLTLLGSCVRIDDERRCLSLSKFPVLSNCVLLAPDALPSFIDTFGTFFIECGTGFDSAPMGLLTFPS